MASPDVAHGRVEWLPWSAGVFARARESRRRVLLWITASWSEGCREMAQTTYADEGIAEAIHARFVPVRLDADERPDIAERYDLGGLPTTAFLDADGAVLGGGTFVPPDRFRLALTQLDAYAVNPAAAVHAEAIVAGVAPPRLAPEPDELLGILRRHFDDEHGGCGAVPKFPHTAAVRLALDLHAASGDEALLAWALRTLDAMASGLSDADGGFFRYCAARDWTRPRAEKLLATNAALTGLMLHAGAAGYGERFIDRARRGIAFIESSLRRADGAWRTAAGVPASRVLTDVNALTISALLHASTVLAEPALAARAIDTLEDLLLATYKPGDGVAHFGGGMRGLLTDQVCMAAACLDACDASGNEAYAMMAEELAGVMLRRLWDPASGGFHDAPAAAGDGLPASCATPLKPFVLNCEAALMLQRLAAATGDDRYSGRAHETLAAMAQRARAQGPLAAHYLLAARAAW